MFSRLDEASGAFSRVDEFCLHEVFSDSQLSLVCYDVCLHIDAFKSFPVYWVFLVWVGDIKSVGC